MQLMYQIFMSEFFNLLPPYIWEGLISLLVTIVGGIIVGVFASNILEKKNEVTRVEGLLIEKKLAVYEEIHDRIQKINSLVIIPTSNADEIVCMLEESGLKYEKNNDYNQLACVFNDVDKLKESFLELDHYFAKNRLYFDNDVFLATLVFQNYYGFFNRTCVLMTAELIDFDVDPENKLSKNIANKMMTGLGMLLRKEFYEQSMKLDNAIGNSINNISMKRREIPDYSYDFYMKDNGYVMRQLKDTIVVNKREEINMFILLHFSNF